MRRDPGEPGGWPIPHWLLRLALLAFPRDFRAAHGRDLIRLILERHRSARNSGLLNGRAAVLADLLGSALGVHGDRLVAALRARDTRGRVRGCALPRETIAVTGSTGGWVMYGIVSDIRHSLRGLARSPGFTATAVLILALGIGATVSVFSVLEAALFRSLPFPHADRLVIGQTTFSGRVNPWSSFPDFVDYRDQSDSFESMAATMGDGRPMTITGGGNAERVQGSLVTVDFFNVLGAKPEAGRTFVADEREPTASEVVVISHGLWQRRFGGSPDVLGRPLVVDGVPRTVVGVLPPNFRFRSDVDVWLPVRMGTFDTEARDSHSWYVYGRLRDGVSIEQAQIQMDVISARLREAYPETHATQGFLLTPLGEVLAAGYRTALLLLMGATVLLLIVACGNVAGLMVSRSTVRRVELSVRTALGASRGALARQLFSESLAVALLAGAGGTVVALGLQRVILAFFPLPLLGITEVGLSTPLLGFAFLVTICTAVIFGVGPSLAASRTDPANDLRGGRRASSGTRGGRVRAGLVSAQVALSVVLLTASGLLVRSFFQLKAVDPGFEAENLLTGIVSISPEKYTDPESMGALFREVVDEVRAIPGVTSASAISHLPIRHPYTNWSVWDPQHPPEEGQPTPSAFARIVLPGYFQTVGVPLLRGRDHEDRDVTSRMPYVVINEAMAARLFPEQDPIGRRLTVNFAQQELRDVEVLGVVRNFRVNALDRQPWNQMYFNYPTMPYPMMNLVVRTTGDPAAIVAPIRRALAAKDPDVPLSDVATMSHIIAESTVGARSLSVVTMAFAIMALLLSMTGLYAVLGYDVARRTQEIGIRVAFGADRVRLLGMIMSRGLALVGVGLIIGLAGAATSNRLVQAQLYAVGTMDLLTFGAVALLLLLGASLASLIPAWRATHVDPMRAIQVE